MSKDAVHLRVGEPYELSTINWDSRLLATTRAVYEGHELVVDQWLLAADQEIVPAIIIGLPHGRDDLIDFIVAALRAAQNVYVQLRPGERLDIHERCPIPERAH